MDVAELVDRALITDTLHAYCDRVDRADVDALLELFTEDAVLDMGAGTTATGRDRLRPLVLALVGRWTHTHHQCSTVTLQRYDGNTAATVSYISVFHDSPARAETMHLWGRYEDELVRVAPVEGGTSWRIRQRRFRVAGVLSGTSSALPERFERFPRQPLPPPRPTLEEH